MLDKNNTGNVKPVIELTFNNNPNSVTELFDRWIAKISQCAINSDRIDDLKEWYRCLDGAVNVSEYLNTNCLITVEVIDGDDLINKHSLNAKKVSIACNDLNQHAACFLTDCSREYVFPRISKEDAVQIFQSSGIRHWDVSFTVISDQEKDGD